MAQRFTLRVSFTVQLKHVLATNMASGQDEGEAL